MASTAGVGAHMAAATIRAGRSLVAEVAEAVGMMGVVPGVVARMAEAAEEVALMGMLQRALPLQRILVNRVDLATNLFYLFTCPAELGNLAKLEEL